MNRDNDRTSGRDNSDNELDINSSKQNNSVDPRTNTRRRRSTPDDRSRLSRETSRDSYESHDEYSEDSEADQLDSGRNPSNHRDYQQKPKGSILSKMVIGILIIAIIAAGAFAYKQFAGKTDEVLMAKIVAVIPNYSTIQIPTTKCRDETTSKQVVNPNRNFINGLFDSKNHPKYVTKTSTKQVCSQENIESQILTNYTVQYQVKDALESMIVQNPPQVNMVMPVSQLQLYVESNNSLARVNASVQPNNANLPKGTNASQ